MELPEVIKDITKGDLNNQRVLLRNVIKRAKLHTISNLVHRLAKLKKAAAKNVPKAKGKSERLLMEINEIKSLKVDEVSRFALMNDRPFAKIAKEGTSKVRALARLSDHQFVAKVIQKFRQEFPKWEVQVPSLFNMWDFKNNVMSKKKKKKSKEESNNSKLEIKQISSDVSMISHQLDTKLEEMDTNAADGNKDDSDANSVVTETQKSDMEEDTSVTKDDKKTIKSPPSSNKDKETSVIKSSKNPNNVNANKKLSLQEISKTLKSQHSKTEVRKVTGDMEIRILNLNEEIEVNTKSKSKTSNQAVQGQKPKSSFFLDMDNNELSDPESEPEENIMSSKTEPGENLPNKQFKPSHSDKQNKKNLRTSNKNNRQPPKPSGKNIKPKGYESRAKEIEEPPKALHPSWEAKRSLNKTAIQEFKGTKIKFDDD